MKQYLAQFFEDFQYPDDAAQHLLKSYEGIYSCKESAQLFDRIISTYENDINCTQTEFLEMCEAISGKTGIHIYTVRLLMYICLSKQLRVYYAQRGVSDDIWRQSMFDLKYKLLECIAVKKIYGTFTDWFWRFYSMTRFALGRLQFEIVSFNHSYEKDGKKLTPESKVINMHIPRTLTPLDKESRLRSYAMAKEFFKDEFKDEPMAFVCSSWLLYPLHYGMLPDTSNVKSFMDDFDIISTSVEEPGSYRNMWRLFDMDYTGDANDYPGDTSLRRVYKEIILSGKNTGSGYGVFFADEV